MSGIESLFIALPDFLIASTTEKLLCNVFRAATASLEGGQLGAQKGKSCCWLTAYVRPAIVAGVAEKHLRQLDLRRESESAGWVGHDTLTMSAFAAVSWWEEDQVGNVYNTTTV